MPPLPRLDGELTPKQAFPHGGNSSLAQAPASDEVLRPAERWRRIVAVAEAYSAHGLDRDELARGVGYPLDAYDLFVRDMPMRPPPEMPALPMTVLVDSHRVAPFLLRATLRSLQDQSYGGWTAVIGAPAAIRDHPVGAFAATDARIHFADTVPDTMSGPVTLINAGTMLDSQALAWLGFALERTGAAAAFADHDHGIADPVLRLVRADPMLHGTFDAALIETAGPPAVIALANGSAAGTPALIEGERARREALLQARAGRIAGVPRVLATKVALPLAARGGTVGPEDLGVGSMAPAREQRSPPQQGTPIAIVIPTRDSATLLMRAVDTLRATARDAARLDIIVVDNRSEAAETSALLRQLQAEGAARVVSLDTPFNWSLASNVGAAASDAPVIAFVNNDIEMLSSGWDDALLEALDDERVGAVGARLLYPNRTIQHAGIAFGFGPTGAEHEGRGVPVAASGPSGRFVTSHDVAAVTGAFLCVRRQDFERVGGFDAKKLMVAHSDIDLCLRLREEGLVIRYCSAIEALHHEGATRGINQTREAIAWDESERADLIDRWGDALSEDPGVSPYWLRGDAPFELLREPSMREIIEHIDRSARADPWRPRRNDAVETTAHAAANRAAAGR